MRLKSAREQRSLSLREFAKEVGEDYTLLARIERGERYPPRQRLRKFANVMSLAPRQLETLIAVERRGLNPHVLLPEISPADISHDWIEHEARKVLNRYCREVHESDVSLPVPIDAVVNSACRLSTEYCDFEREKEISGRSGELYGGLYPDGFRGKDRLVVVNTGRIRGKELSFAEKRITVAHEAGHYMLHCGNKDSAQLFLQFNKGPTFCREAECDQTPFNSLEYQASAFGACLLLPRQQFLRKWQGMSASNLAESFEVTESFVRLRAKMLGLLPRSVNNSVNNR